MAEEDKEGVPSSRLSVIDIGKRMKNIFLHGKLGERFGRTWKLNVGSPTEAINALFANEPLIEKYLNKKQQEGVSYGVKKHKGQGFISKEEYGLLSSSDIHIFPIPQGAGAFAVSLLIAVATTAASMYVSKKMAEAMERDDSTVTIQTKSFLYEGGENRLQQGGTVPLGYGRLKVGSNVISSCVVNYDYDSDKGDIFNFNSGIYLMGRVSSTRWIQLSRIYKEQLHQHILDIRGNMELLGTKRLPWATFRMAHGMVRPKKRGIPSEDTSITQ